MKIEKLSFYSIVAALFVVPFIFLSPAFLFPEYAKVYLLVACVVVSALSTVYVFWQKKKITIIKHPIVWALLAINVVNLISSIWSGMFGTSFLGQGVELGTMSLFLIMSVALYVTAVRLGSAENTDSDTITDRTSIIYITLIVLFVIIFVYHALRLFVGPDFLSFGIFTQITSTFLGRWHELSIFSGLTLMLLVSSFEYLSLRPVIRWTAGVASVFALALTVISGFTALWIIVGILMLCIIVSKYATTKSFAWYSLALLILACIFVFARTSTVVPLMNHFGVTETELSLPWQSTVDIAAGTIKSKPAFGIGPNQFVVAYNAFKPSYINNTPAWMVDFTYGVGIVPTFAVTTGVVGVIAWIVFLWLILRSGFDVFRQKSKAGLKDSHNYVLMSSLIGTVFMWFMAVVYTPSYWIWLLTFIMTGIFVSAVSSASNNKVSSVEWDHSSKKGIFVSVVAIIISIAFILLLVVYSRSVIAQIYFQSGAAESSDIHVAENKLTKAISWHDIDVYERSLATAYLVDFQNFVSGKLANGGTLTASDTEMISPVIKSAVDASDRALALNPNNYVNYLAKAKVLGILAQAKVDKAHETAIELYQQAATLSPNNPSIFYQAALLETNLGNAELAQKFFSGAIQMKPDYTDALAMLGSVLLEGKSYDNALAAFNRVIEINQYYQNIHYFKALALVGQEKITDAIAELELAVKANPNEPIISKYLEQLKTQRSLPAKTADLPLAASSTPEIKATTTKSTGASTKK